MKNKTNSKQMNLVPTILQITGVMYEPEEWIHRSEGNQFWCRLRCENTLNFEQSLKHMDSGVNGHQSCLSGHFYCNTKGFARCSGI